MPDSRLKTARELRDLIADRELSAVEVTGQFLDRIEQVDSRLKAFVTVDPDGALRRAEQIDKQIASGETVGPLAGVPIAVKDNMCTRGLLTTCSSKILKNYVPPYDATVVSRINDAGAVVVGKTNLDEFAMGSSTENSAFETTRNPWDLERVPGGSSGGSAAAVSACEAPLALGSDTGGSIRQPASLCGVTGMKPTYGLVSRYGLVAFASSLDQIGPFARTVEDCALLLSVISGHDPLDSTSADLPTPNYLAHLDEPINPLRIGVPQEYFAEGIDPEVEAAVREAIAVYEKLGAEIVEISLPHTKYAVAVYYVVATAEASSNLARYDGVHYGYRTDRESDLVEMFCRSREEGFGAEVKRRIMLGAYALSSGYYDAYYLKASRVRSIMRADFDEAFKQVDVIACPTSPTAAFRIGEKTADPLQMYLSDIYTISANLAGNPGITLPCGFTRDNLPIGLQLMGTSFDEENLLRVAQMYQKETDFHLREARL